MVSARCAWLAWNSCSEERPGQPASWPRSLLRGMEAKPWRPELARVSASQSDSPPWPQGSASGAASISTQGPGASGVGFTVPERKVHSGQPPETLGATGTGWAWLPKNARHEQCCGQLGVCPCFEGLRWGRDRAQLTTEESPEAAWPRLLEDCEVEEQLSRPRLPGLRTRAL